MEGDDGAAVPGGARDGGPEVKLWVCSGGFSGGGGSSTAIIVEMVAVFVADKAANDGSQWWSKVVVREWLLSLKG